MQDAPPAPRARKGICHDNSTTTVKIAAHTCPIFCSTPRLCPPALQTHCGMRRVPRRSSAELRATFAALDAWTAPEPSPYFDTRLHAASARSAGCCAGRLLGAHALVPAVFSTGRQLRPALAGALALALVVSGGSVVGYRGLHPVHAQRSATVNDLKILDNNAQAIQQMDQLLDDSSDDQDAPAGNVADGRSMARFLFSTKLRHGLRPSMINEEHHGY